MKIKNYDRFKWFFLGITITALGLSLIGMRDIRSTPYAGFELSSDYKVIRVVPTSPAALAGMKVGDRLIELGGVPTQKLYELSKLSRPTIGEEQQVAVMRNQIRHDFSLKQAPLPVGEKLILWAKNFMALTMIATGFAMFWAHRNKVGSLFLLFNLFAALALMTPPYFQSFALRKVVALNFLVFLSLALALLLHLTLVFPKPKPSVIDTPVELLIYFPVPIAAIFYAVFRLFQPEADLLLNQALHYAFALLVSACVALVLAALAHSFWTSARSNRTLLAGVLLCSVIGLIPIALKVVVDSFLPQVTLAGREVYELLPLLVTLSLAWAISEMSPPEDFAGLQRAA
jgi:PDZ domain-containing protein